MLSNGDPPPFRIGMVDTADDDGDEHGARISGESDAEETVGIPLIHSSGGDGPVHSKLAGTDAEIIARTRTAAAPGATRLVHDTTLPLPKSLGLACMYIFTSVFYFLSIRYSKTQYTYDSAFLVLMIEFMKLCVSTGLKYREDGEFLPKTVLCGRNRGAVWRSGLPYATPSFLYAVYNNMTFFNLNMFDPGTYQVFMQTRILFTGVLFTVFLHQALTYRKWVGLIILAIGVVTKYLSPATIQLDNSIVYVLMQALLSSLAGVYNEYVFKKHLGLSIHQQNFFMYFYALFFNIVIGLLVAPNYYRHMDVASVAHPIFLVIVLLGVGVGLSAAFILKFINVIVKAFSSAVEVLLTSVTAAVLLGEALTGQDVAAAGIVMVAVYAYCTRGVGDGHTVKFGMG